MSLTLTHPTDGAVNLPDQLAWVDEFTWNRVAQAQEYTTTGAMILDAWVKLSGRPITLKGSETRAWCERGALLTIRAWADIPGLTLTLTGLRGIPRQVVFDHDGGAIEAVAIEDWEDKQDDDPYAITLKFLEL
jgi:hypothetical protein